MYNTRFGRIVFLIVFFLFLTAVWGRASVVIQCPPDTDGIDTDGDGDPNNDNVSMHLAAGDGFVNMAIMLRVMLCCE